MPKVIQMPRRHQPEDEGRSIHSSKIVPDTFEESESLGEIQRWLELADSVLEGRAAAKKRSA